MEFDDPGQIYTLQLPIPPPPPPLSHLLSISPSAGNLDISWLIAFNERLCLQQNSDLTTTNWTDVPITPLLNFTNLNYQVSVSPTNGQGFYRLKQQ